MPEGYTYKEWPKWLHRQAEDGTVESRIFASATDVPADEEWVTDPAEVGAADEGDDEITELRARLDAKSVAYHGRAGVKKLRALLEAAG